MFVLEYSVLAFTIVESVTIVLLLQKEKKYFEKGAQITFL